MAKFLAVLAVHLFLTRALAAQSAATGDLTSRLNAVIVQNVEFRQTTVREAVEFLRREYRRLSGADLPLSLNLTEAALNIRISMTLDKIPILAAYEYVGKAANLDVSVQSYGLCVQTRQAAAVTPPSPTPDPYAASLARAQAIFPDIARLNTPLGKAGAEEIDRMTAAKDPALNDPRAPEIIAARVANRLGIAPIAIDRRSNDSSLVQSTPAGVSRQHSLSMEAKSVATGGSSNILSSANSTDATAYYPSGNSTPAVVRNFEEHRHLSSGANVEVKLRDFSGTKDTVTLEWYFFAYPVGTTAVQSSKEAIFDHGSQTVTVPANASDTWVVSSKDTHAVTDRYASVARSTDGSSGVEFYGGGSTRANQSQSGWIMKGWCVRVVDAGRVVVARGSSQNYEDIAKDNAKLKTFAAAQ